MNRSYQSIPQCHSRLAVVAGAAILTAALAACGGSDYNGGGSAPTTPTTPTPPPVVNTLFKLTGLVSDTATTAANVDKNLVNAWGIAFNPTGFVWVNNAGTSTSTLYDGNGVPQSLVVSTPSGPTGLVFNGSSDFKITQNGVTAASPFIFASLSGTISAWSPTVNRTTAVKVYDGAADSAAYKGLAIAAYNGVNYIYAADFHNGRVDVFNGSFAKTTLPGAFKDPSLPAGYAPFGMQAVGDRIYVTFALKSATSNADVKAAGNGYVDVFDTAGNLVKQLVSGGALNSPWGLAVAPSNFGTYSGKLLVGNFGDGKINAYDATTGALAGTLAKSDGSAIVIDGLWGISFGNGVSNQPTNTLFFTAGPNAAKNGLYGRVDMM